MLRLIEENHIDLISFIKNHNWCGKYKAVSFTGSYVTIVGTEKIFIVSRLSIYTKYYIVLYCILTEIVMCKNR